jgi:hypothetical protein
MGKKQFGINLDVEVGKWALKAAPRLGFANRSVMIEELLRAVQSGKIILKPPAPDPFPAETEAPLGSSPDHPLPFAQYQENS